MSEYLRKDALYTTLLAAIIALIHALMYDAAEASLTSRQALGSCFYIALDGRPTPPTQGGGELRAPSCLFSLFRSAFLSTLSRCVGHYKNDNLPARIFASVCTYVYARSGKMRTGCARCTQDLARVRFHRPDPAAGRRGDVPARRHGPGAPTLSSAQ